MERLDGKEKWSVVESPRERRSIQTVVLNEAVFVQYLDAGAWHLAFYNDGREREIVSFSTNIMGETKKETLMLKEKEVNEGKEELGEEVRLGGHSGELGNKQFAPIVSLIYKITQLFYPLCSNKRVRAECSA